MSERERWIVYPLLFLALGSALRDKIAKQTQTKEIVCERLFLVDSDGQSVGALIGDTSQLGPGDLRLLSEMRRTNSQMAISGVLANVVDSESIFSLNKPIRPPTANPTFRTLGELMQYLQRMGINVTPRLPSAAPGVEPAPENSAPSANPARPVEPEPPRAAQSPTSTATP